MASYPTSVKSFSTHAVGDLITAAESNSYHEEITAIETDLVGRQIVNVKSDGAVGDSSTDDTAAIQAAVTACNNGVVYLPKGTYRISTTVTKLYTASVSFVGDGLGVTTLLFDDTANEGIAITGASDGGDGYVTTLAAGASWERPCLLMWR